MANRFPFRNLVFQGGGVKAYAYHGVLEVLEATDVLPQIERVAGTSAGAMLAALLSMRLSVDEIVAIYRTVDPTQMPTGPANHPGVENERLAVLERELARVQMGFSSLLRLFTHFGLHPTRYGYEWIKETLARYCDGDAGATFADFRTLGHRDLYVVVTNVSRHATEVFCAEQTPHVAVADALLMSQTIPFYFEALQFDGRRLGQGHHYADGGILLNYPLQLFDEPRYARNNRWYVNGVNWETLGCRLYTPEDCPQTAVPITNLLAYIQNLFEALRETQTVAFENDKVDQHRTINISNCCVDTTDFTVHPTLKNKKYAELVVSGRQAALDYLTNYQPPVIKSRASTYLAFLRRVFNRL